MIILTALRESIISCHFIGEETEARRSLGTHAGIHTQQSDPEPGLLTATLNCLQRLQKVLEFFMGPPLSQFEGRDSGLLDSVAK